MGIPPFKGAQAHHGLLWNFKDWFARRGLNVNDPRVGALVRGGGNGGHQSWSNEYNRVWSDFIANNPNATATQVKQFYEAIRKSMQWGVGF